MKNGICPRCGEAEVYVDRGRDSRPGIIISFWETVLLVRYVCTSCGYVESYVDDEAKLEVIREKWSRVNPVP
jgi:predicted RNA-binding Zn-ribbon protein involved in translation (DUF1610 family)